MGPGENQVPPAKASEPGRDAACFVVARYLSGAGRRGLAIYSRITGVAFLVALAGVTTGSGSPAVVLPFYAAVTAIFTWLAVVCVHLYRRVA